MLSEGPTENVKKLLKPEETFKNVPDLKHGDTIEL